MGTTLYAVERRWGRTGYELSVFTGRSHLDRYVALARRGAGLMEVGTATEAAVRNAMEGGRTPAGVHLYIPEESPLERLPEWMGRFIADHYSRINDYEYRRI